MESGGGRRPKGTLIRPQPVSGQIDGVAAPDHLDVDIQFADKHVSETAPPAVPLSVCTLQPDARAADHLLQRGRRLIGPRMPALRRIDRQKAHALVNASPMDDDGVTVDDADEGVGGGVAWLSAGLPSEAVNLIIKYRCLVFHLIKTGF